MSNSNQLLITLGNIRKNVYGPTKKWDCIVDSCNEPAIVSHLLQRNGILDLVAENGHMILVQASEPYGWANDRVPVDFMKIGIRGSLSIPLFCDRHDTELFAEIEQSEDGNDGTPLNPYNYRHQLLLSLRTLYAEKRRKQQAVEMYKRMSVAHTLTSDIQHAAKQQLQLQLVGIRDIDLYLKDLQAELIKPKGLLDFKVFDYEEMKVCSTAGISLCDDIEKNRDLDYVLPIAFFHAFPLNGIFYVVVGYHKAHKTSQVDSFVNSWSGLSKPDLQKELTKLFVQRVETWGMAPSLFSTISADKINRFKQLQYEAYMSMPMPEIDFNFFG